MVLYDFVVFQFVEFEVIIEICGLLCVYFGVIVLDNVNYWVY